MSKLFIRNDKKTKALMNYFINNRLTEDEIMSRLSTYAESYFIAGLDKGSSLERIRAKKISDMKGARRKKAFDKILEEIDDKMTQERHKK